MRLSSVSFLLWFAFAANTASLTADDAIAVKLSGEPGPYTVEHWKKDWPGCEWEDGIMEGHASLVSHEGNNRLRINYAIGQIGPEKCGVGWRWPFGKHDAAEFSYTVRFSKDFDWVKGGKLPGFCGGPDNVSGGRPATGTNGFSARLMWRMDGRGEAYVYHKHQKSNYGDSFSFPEDFRFPTEKSVHVRLAVTMNIPGQRNGTVRVWIAIGDEKEKLMVERIDMEWRTVGTFGVDSLYFETFHGGGDESWAPTRECWAEFGEMRVKG